MIEVKLSFSSMAEAAAFFQSQQTTTPVAQAASPFASAAAPVVEVIREAAIAPAPVAEPAAKEKKTRKTKEQPAVEESAAGAPNPEAPTYTIEHIRTALADMIARTDFETGTALVREFKTADGAQAARLSELREADWAEFIRRSKVAA